MNLLRALNLDIAAIQVLSRQEVEPAFPIGATALVDSETQAEIKLQWNANARRDYQVRLAQHNSEIRSFCHQSAIHYSLYVTDRDLSGFCAIDAAQDRAVQIDWLWSSSIPPRYMV